MARDDQAAEGELEVLALEGLKSGESIEADERYWADKCQQLIGSCGNSHSRTGYLQ